MRNHVQLYVFVGLFQFSAILAQHLQNSTCSCKALDSRASDSWCTNECKQEGPGAIDPTWCDCSGSPLPTAPPTPPSPASNCHNATDYKCYSIDGYCLYKHKQPCESGTVCDSDFQKEHSLDSPCIDQIESYGCVRNGMSYQCKKGAGDESLGVCLGACGGADGNWVPVFEAQGFSAEHSYHVDQQCADPHRVGNMCWKLDNTNVVRNFCQRRSAGAQVAFGHGISGSNMNCGECAKVRVMQSNGQYRQLCLMVTDVPRGTSNEMGKPEAEWLGERNMDGWLDNLGGSRYSWRNRLGFEYEFPADCRTC